MLSCSVQQAAFPVFDSYSIWVKNNKRVVIIGDHHCSYYNGHSLSTHEKQDQKDKTLILDIINFFHQKKINVHILLEWSQKKSQEVRNEIKQGFKPGMLYSLSLFLENHQKQFKTISFNACDNRPPEVLEINNFVGQILYASQAERFLDACEKVYPQNIRKQHSGSYMFLPVQNYPNGLWKWYTAGILRIGKKKCDFRGATYKQTRSKTLQALQPINIFLQKNLTVEEKKSLFFIKNKTENLIKASNELFKLKQTQSFIEIYVNQIQEISQIKGFTLLLAQFNFLRYFNPLVNIIADINFALCLIQALKKQNNILFFGGNYHAIEINKTLKNLGFEEIIQRGDLTKQAPNLVESKKDPTLVKKSLARLFTHVQSSKTPTTPIINREEMKIHLRTIFQKDGAKKIDTLKRSCSICGKTSNLMVCTACKKVHYCSKSCQLEDWPNHKKVCTWKSKKKKS